MKYCPTCETRYDEDILRFCMKDGTPLLDDAEPNFIEMPSESLDAAAPVDPDDPSEHTIIRRNPPSNPTPAIPQEAAPAPPPPQEPIEDFSDVRRHEPSGGQRIVVPTFEEQQRQERARVAAQYQNQQPRGSNTVAIVALTMFGTVFVLVIVGAVLYFLLAGRGDSAANANTNLNANQSVNLNTNQWSNGVFDPNIAVPNFNSNSNANANANANVKTPTPTPKPSVTPTPTPDDDDGDPTPTPTVNITPSTPRPATPTPRPPGTPIPVPTPRTIMTPANRPNN